MSWPSATDTKRLLLAGVLVVLTLALLTFVGPSLYEVTDKGKDVVPYDSGVVYELRVLDEFTLYAPEEARPKADNLSGIGLVAAATVAFMTVLLLDSVRAAPRVRRLYIFVASGLAFLAADEIFALHESLGHNLQFLADVPGVNRPDDLIFSLYSIPLLIFTWRFRDVLLAHREPVRLFAVGILFFAVAAVGDLVGSYVDELAEVIAALCLVAGIVLMSLMTLRQEVGADGTFDSQGDRPANGSAKSVAADSSPPAAPTR